MIEPERLLADPPRGHPRGARRRALAAQWSLVRLVASNLVAFVGTALAMLPLLPRRRPVGRAGARDSAATRAGEGERARGA